MSYSRRLTAADLWRQPIAADSAPRCPGRFGRYFRETDEHVQADPLELMKCDADRRWLRVGATTAVGRSDVDVRQQLRLSAGAEPVDGAALERSCDVSPVSGQARTREADPRYRQQRRNDSAGLSCRPIPIGRHGPDRQKICPLLPAARDAHP